jgi:hypothetical protein
MTMARGRQGLLAAALAATILGVAPGGALADRYASPDSTDVTGACAEDAPCRLDHAIEGAVADDLVILKPGTYAVDYRINPSVPVHVQGEDGAARPKLLGSWNALDPAPAVLELLKGGSLRHLKVQASELMQGALQIADVTAEDLLVRSSGAEAVSLLGGATGTLLRDSVVESTYPGMAAVGIDDGPAGVADVDMRNVTAVAHGAGAVGLQSRVVQSQVTLLNVIARGGLGANDLEGQDPKLKVGHSNFRPGLSFGVGDLGGNQSGDPLFVDPAGFDYRTFDGSPTIDAGTQDALNGDKDPDGESRNKGSAPNIGAYERAVEHVYKPPEPVQPPPGDKPPLGDKPPVEPGPESQLEPELGVSVVGGVAGGLVAFQPAGSSDFVSLEGDAEIPVGSLVDARRGAVRLRSARDAGGSSQVGVFSGAMFRVRQPRRDHAYTVLKLAGGSFASCRTGAPASAGTAAASSRRSRAVRRLWGRSRRGRFRTRGRHGTATVRGTVWSTADRCDGTMVRVRRGRVLVRDFRLRRSVMVGSGQSYLARRSATRRTRASADSTVP